MLESIAKVVLMIAEVSLMVIILTVLGKLIYIVVQYFKKDKPT